MFTPSEGGAVAVLYCIIIGRFVYKKLSLKEHLVPILLTVSPVLPALS
ncbi:MAG: hypothetical protein ACLR3S_09780 [Clostridium fessum]